jgi:hypothetical protein
MGKKSINRRKFFTLLGTGGVALATQPISELGMEQTQIQTQNQTVQKPSTNIKDAAKVPRNATSMPGKFPGKVVHIRNSKSVVNDEPVEKQANLMIEKAMLELTGENSLRKAWRIFVNPYDRIGLKVNPIGGRLLSTSHAVVKSVINQLQESGIDKKQIIIWDRRPVQFLEAGFTSKKYPGIKIIGTEEVDDKGSFYDKEGKLYSLKNNDQNWYYYADYEEKYDAEVMPIIINEGKYSYFSTIVTKDLDKIINIPILKNNGNRITNAMKNVAFGSVSNTMRLHKQLWHETCAEVCAFAPIRDKVVLNICDALRGGFNGGPHPTSPEFLCNFNSILIATDPVALDRISAEIMLKKRISEGFQKPGSIPEIDFLTLASSLGLGVSDINKIELSKVDL